MDWLITIFTVRGSYKFVIDSDKMNCNGFLKLLAESGKIVVQIPFTYFESVQMIGYACSVVPK